MTVQTDDRTFGEILEDGEVAERPRWCRTCMTETVWQAVADGIGPVTATCVVCGAVDYFTLDEVR